MKFVSTCLMLLLAAASAVPQNAPSAPSSRAAIEGLVTKEPGSEPVKKALIELIAENQAEGGDYTAVTGADGIFRVEGIAPGRYRLFVERTGFLEFDKNHARTDGRVLTLVAGQEVKDVRIHLQAAAVVRGRVTDEDGDPLPNAQVAVLHQTYFAGRSRLEQTGTERTNDLGEYRIAGLPSGNYYVSVSPPPDFKSLIEGANAAAAQPRNAADKPAPTSYQATYYPGTVDRSQAAPIQLHAGDDFPVNFSLTPSPSLSIRGSVVNLPPRASASIMLQSHDFGLVLNGADMQKDGSFVIRDVSPGSYTILATVDNAPVQMTAQQSLQVTNSVDGLRLAPQPGALLRGRLRVESKGGMVRLDAGQIFLALQSKESDSIGLGAQPEGFSNLMQVRADGSFEFKDVPPGNYYVQLMSDPGSSQSSSQSSGQSSGQGSKQDATQEWFVKSVLAGGRDVNDSDLSVSGGGIVLDVVVSANGAAIDGVVIDKKGAPVANAVIVAVPEVRLRGRADRYRKKVTDQSGRFTLHGIPPGDYTALAWESLDGEAYYNPEILKTYEEQGITLHLSEGDRKTMQVEVIPAAEDQP